MQSQNRKKRQRAERKENNTTQKIGKGIRDVKIKETRLGSYEELYTTMVLRILLGQSLKMRVIVVTKK